MPGKAEEWRAVAEFEGCYEVSSLGRVRSLDRISAASIRIPNGRRITGKILASKNKTGRGMLHLQRGDKIRVARVAVLVCETFIGPRPSSSHEVDHIDEDRTNDSAMNLQWLDGRQNKSKSAAKRHWQSRIGRRAIVSLMETGDYTCSDLMELGYTSYEIKSARLPGPTCKGFNKRLGKKLTNNDAAKIKGLLAQGILGVQIAELFRVDPGLISRIKSGRTRAAIVPVCPTDEEIKSVPPRPPRKRRQHVAAWYTEKDVILARQGFNEAANAAALRAGHKGFGSRERWSVLWVCRLAVATDQDPVEMLARELEDAQGEP